MSVRFLVICLNPTIQRTLVFSNVIPGQVNRAKNQWVHGSGKGVNTTRVLHQLGASVTHLTQVGGCTGSQFTELVKSDGLSLVPLPITQGIRTCTTIIDESTGSVTELVEEGIPVDPNHQDIFFQIYIQLLTEHQVILLNGSKAPGFSQDIFPRLVMLAKEQNRQVFVDYRGTELLDTIQFRPNWIKINLQECIATWFPQRETLLEGSSVHLTQSEFELLMELHHSYNICFLITHGGQPALGIWDNQFRWFEIPQTKGVNPIGSGDSVFAGLAWAISQGKDVAEAIEFGLDCGRRNYLQVKPGSIF
jgi:1-phosphofructokinase family hexose kinase